MSNPIKIRTDDEKKVIIENPFEAGFYGFFGALCAYIVLCIGLAIAWVIILMFGFFLAYLATEANKPKPKPKPKPRPAPIVKPVEIVETKDQKLTRFQIESKISDKIVEAAIKEWVMAHNGNFDYNFEEVKVICLRIQKIGV